MGIRSDGKVLFPPLALVPVARTGREDVVSTLHQINFLECVYILLPCFSSVWLIHRRPLTKLYPLWSRSLKKLAYQGIWHIDYMTRIFIWKGKSTVFNIMFCPLPICKDVVLHLCGGIKDDRVGWDHMGSDLLWCQVFPTKVHISFIKSEVLNWPKSGKIVSFMS